MGVGPQQPFDKLQKGLITGCFQPLEGHFWGQNGAFKKKLPKEISKDPATEKNFP
jgi:hypothetical protein